MNKKIVGILACMLLIIGNIGITTQVTNLIEASNYNHKMHFPQKPDLDGWDVSASYFDWVESGICLADDWMCSETGQISNIEFWGGWKNGVEGTVDGFWVSIYENVPASSFDNLNGLPGEKLWEQYIDDYTVTYVGSFDCGWDCGTIS